MHDFIKKYRQVLSICLSVAVSVFFVALAVSAATTIGTNISTGGNLTVTGTGSFTGLLTPSGGISTSTLDNVAIGGSTPTTGHFTKTSSTLFSAYQGLFVGTTATTSIYGQTTSTFPYGATFATTGGDVSIGRKVFFTDANRNLLIQGLDATAPAMSASDNTIVGTRSYLSATTGWRNASFGGDTLHDNTTGYYNTAIGHGVMKFNTTGFHNTAIGGDALRQNVDGEGNAAVGLDALFNNTSGDNNIAMGQSAMNNNTSGNLNVALGSNALFNSTSTDYNIAVGANAGYDVTNGAENIFIGLSSGRGNNQKVNVYRSIAIGRDVQTTKDYQIILGGTEMVETLLRGNVGIGNDSPTSTLSLGGGSVTTPWLTIGNGTASSTFGGYSTTATTTNPYGAVFANLGGSFGVGTNNPTGLFDVNGKLTVLSGGNVGIGTTAPSSTLELYKTTGPWLTIGNGSASTTITAGNDLTATSTFAGSINAYAFYARKTPTYYPDYVFEQDYKLIDFNDLQKYVADNKHLPGMPSVKEVQGGFDLANFGLNLLEKIEELYLYVFKLADNTKHSVQMLWSWNEEQDKEIQALKNQIKNLQKELEATGSK
ncbi:MAG: hypothetical protein V1661_01795 [bacterium]